VSYPRLDIDCAKIYHNTHALINQLGLKDMTVTPVTKVCLGHPVIAQTLVDAGASRLADSRIETIEKMKRSGISEPMMLIRTPMLSQAASIVQYCDISLNSEIAVIQRLSMMARKFGVTHGVIVMVELGDLREGVMPEKLIDLIGNIIRLPNIILKGIGSNLACRYGVAPDNGNMSQLSDLADQIEKKFSVHLEIISGGNSASLYWALNHTGRTRVNDLRLGEAIFLGCEALYGQSIKGLFSDVITLTAEVIESNQKPSMPWGDREGNAFGERQLVVDRGVVSQAILAVGRQDVAISGMTPPSGITIVSSTSDHLIVETPHVPLVIGQKITFRLNYSAVLFAMSSPFVDKFFIDNPQQIKSKIA
jgi:predicted amino acid racemase